MGTCTLLQPRRSSCMCAMPLVLSRDISWNKGVFCLDQPRSIVWELCKIMPLLAYLDVFISSFVARLVDLF